ncbi:receptor-activated Ca2+-permeable cation channel [Rickenella mellea]|uniref:Receptor-activated Ca2+-permeable cation channel n=1 Tax=Rickenella mellea TaxID=50990 RepID=A0A4Y7QCW0_9AGAM|nr:receptor-activated Ca2+-permeable cation channel [Rickenella mellea]
MDPEDQVNVALLAPSPELLATVKVFPLLPHLKADVTVNSSLTWEQLTASDINFAVIRPLVAKYARLHNMAVVYACLVVRSHFLEAADRDIAHAALMTSRAATCELLAMKLLRHFASSQIELCATLTTSWSPIAGAPPEVVAQVREALGDDDELDDPTSALEIAIATKSKFFLSSTLVQTVVNNIYSGRIVFSTQSKRSLLADNYKPRAIEVYDTRTAPFLDHYRLRVPRYSAILELVNFSVLLLVFILCLSNQSLEYIDIWEFIFLIFALAFVLAEYTASREHGWSIYIASMWNVFDTAFIVIFLAYFAFRVKGLLDGDLWASNMAFDILACSACIIFPRLAFFAIKNNVIILALRGMIAEFVFFMGVAAVCFSGLLFTLWMLASGTWTIKSIAWLMVQIWFGNTYLSFAQAESFHPLFGPILMTGFAALSNTLLLTILISILSNTFARIDANASREYLFQFTISTIEGVKSDALFSYQPPFNLFAYILLLPLSWVLTPRALHSANVFLIKLTSFPILIIIGIYERYFAAGQKLRESGKDAANSMYRSLPRNLKNMPLVEALMGASSHDLYDVIFDVELAPGADISLFGYSEDEHEHEEHEEEEGNHYLRRPPLRNITSRESFGGPALRRRPTSRSSAPRTPERRPPSTASAGAASPKLKSAPAIAPNVLEAPASPLSRLFTRPRVYSAPDQVPAATALAEDALAGIKKMEALLEGVRDLPVQKLKDEMKELQDRQARIETLLLTLTRGMRNDFPPSRHNSSPMS